MGFQWLHRVGFKLGGRDSTTNLCFGTSECNSHMLTVEKIIIKMLQHNSTNNMTLLLTTEPFDNIDQHGGPENPSPGRWLGFLVHEHLGSTDFVRPAGDELPFSWAIPFMKYTLTVSRGNTPVSYFCSRELFIDISLCTGTRMLPVL